MSSCDLCKKPAGAHALKRCPYCKAVYYGSVDHQSQIWLSHQSTCSKAKASIHAVRSRNGKGIPFFPEDVEITADHKIWTSGEISPVSTLFGTPILVCRELNGKIGPHPQEWYDNQAVTFLMIDPSSGFAPPHWQSYIGPCILARADKKPFDRFAFELVWMFFCELIEEFGNTAGAARQLMNKLHFEEFALDSIECNENIRGHVSIPL